MSLLTFGLGVTGVSGGGGMAFDVEVLEPEAIEVVEQSVIAIKLEEPDFVVKVVQRETKIIKE